MGFDGLGGVSPSEGASRWAGPIDVPPGPPVVYQWSSRVTVRALGFTAIVLGLVILAGGPQRFSGSGFAVARIVPGGAYTWGGIITGCGFAVILASLSWHRKAIALALLIAAAWNAAFASFIAVAAASNPATSMTGVVIYGSYAVMCLIQYATSKGLST